MIRTGSADNKTEGNRFTNLYQAFTVVGRNTSGNDIPWTGLQMQCSENFQNVYDQVIETDGDPNSGIRILQGNNVNYNLVDKFEDAYISLFDFTGREIKRQKLVAPQSQVQWQTDDMQTGLYLISIYTDNRLVWKTKVSIQK